MIKVITGLMKLSKWFEDRSCFTVANHLYIYALCLDDKFYG